MDIRGMLHSLVLLYLLAAPIWSENLNHAHATLDIFAIRCLEGNCTDTDDPPPLEQPEYYATVVQREVLVHFHDYAPAASHAATLSQIFPQTCAWTLVERRNEAAKFPTDFLVVRISETCSPDRMVAALATLQTFVKRISAQRKFQRRLLQQQQQQKTHRTRRIPLPARPCTAFSFDSPAGSEADAPSSPRRTLLRSAAVDFDPTAIWRAGFTGAGVKVAVFDTGLSSSHPDFRFIDERTDWTDDGVLDDRHGHGTMVAGIIASTAPACRGLAPDARIHAFRVFTAAEVSHTSWFLDAFNYALLTGITVLNLSIGGPDFLDAPFVEKVNEMSASGIVMVSAIGNDGPYYGTLNNPADMMDVIGVGGVTDSGAVAEFSSRGMTTHELPQGYGRVKPDLVASGTVDGPQRGGGGCRRMSGTSVAAPVVAGAVALLASVVSQELRGRHVNPASMKQVLIESASRLPGQRLVEVGFGRLDLGRAFELMQAYRPRASITPATLDLTDCPLMWPYCTQPLYYGALPVIVNMTILNGMSVTGVVAAGPVFVEYGGAAVHRLRVRFAHSDVLWPWVGYLAVFLEVADPAFVGVVDGTIKLSVASTAHQTPTRTELEVPVRVRVVTAPPRSQLVLWDQFHSLRYPSGYFPRDNIQGGRDTFDWQGDHIHTNFHRFYDHLRERGFFLEVLGQAASCVDLRRYGVLLIVDSEEEFFAEEISAIQVAVEQQGLALVVFAEWHNEDMMRNLEFLDSNTDEWKSPVTGGGNMPALNKLLRGFGIGLGSDVVRGAVTLPASGSVAQIRSGTHIRQFPVGGQLVSADVSLESSQQQQPPPSSMHGQRIKKAVLGLYQLPKEYPARGTSGRDNSSVAEDESRGRVAVFGDASCLDTVGVARGEDGDCFAFACDILTWAGSPRDAMWAQHIPLLKTAFEDRRLRKQARPPARVTSQLLANFSRVLQTAGPVCNQFANLVVDAHYEMAVRPMGDSAATAVAASAKSDTGMSGGPERGHSSRADTDFAGSGGPAISTLSLMLLLNGCWICVVTAIVAGVGMYCRRGHNGRGARGVRGAGRKSMQV